MSPRRAARPELVIFDCDGVLVDSEPISNRVLAQELSAIGLATTVESSMRDYMGRSWPACVEIFEARLGRALPPGFTEAFFERLVEARIAEVRDMRLFVNLFADAMTGEILRESQAVFLGDLLDGFADIPRGIS